MKIAVTYDNGNVFQHFGKTENFKVYQVEDGKVLSSEVMSSNGTGHGALAGLLAEQGVDVLICGGIGAEQKTRLRKPELPCVQAQRAIQIRQWKPIGGRAGIYRSELRSSSRRGT